MGKRLNPFGSGTFFIHDMWEITNDSEVLIPLVQGRFLFPRKTEHLTDFTGLNPFGSWTFFIPDVDALPYTITGLNPFGSGTFFIRIGTNY